MTTNIDHLALNRAAWDRRTAVHLQSDFYDVPGFLAGGSSLREIEQAELTDVADQRLLHLQCHFGLDTLSWARLGARCTGVDLSPVAIEAARDLSRQSGLAADFVCSDVLSYERGEQPPFDIVFTSYGAVCWLPDLARWAEVIADNLRPGGRFYMVEFHPVIDLLTGYGYFGDGQPTVEDEVTYTENANDLATRVAVWTHPLSAVVGALRDAGIVIDRLNEFPFSPYDCFDGLEEREAGRYYLAHEGGDAPLVYSVLGYRS